MGVYIRGMEMPTEGTVIAIYKLNGKFYASVHGTELCPLVPVPKHGDLIDRDALTDAIDSTDWYHQAPSKDMVLGANSAEHQAWYKWQDINAAVYNAPNIIPAEEGE